MSSIPLAKADVGAAETEAVMRVMARGRLARGPEIDAFEAEFAAWLGVRGAVAMNSGTSALMAALLALQIKPGDEVVMPALTFIATANAILNCGAKPVLVDVDPVSWNLDPNAVEAAMTQRTRAVVAVHLFGAPAAMHDLLDIAGRHRVPLIEDACEAVGARYDGRRVGGLADAGVFGFYPNKVLTTGEGGMLVSDSDEVVQRSRAIANQGRGEDGHFVGTHGFSFRATELGAALGRAQLDSLDERLDRRAALAKRYDRALGNVPGVATPSAQDGARSWFVYPVRLDAAVDRDRVMRELATAGIETAAYFPAIHQDARLRSRIVVPHELPVSEALGRQLLSLPFWLDMTDETMAEIVMALQRLLQEC